MANLSIKLVVRPYDMLTPLASGEIRPEGIDLAIDFETPMARFMPDPAFQAGELSIAQYVTRLSKGDDEVTGLPVVVARGFRQRCFFVRRDSGLSAYEDLRGKRIGIDAWGATGHTWNRAHLREAGVDISSIEWVIGPPEDPNSKAAVSPLPPYASNAPAGQTLVNMLLAGDLDAIIMSIPPQIFYQPESPVVRLFENYRQVEEAYAARVGFWPCLHIVGIRTSVLDEHPWIAGSLFNAFDASQKLAAERRMRLADCSPWQLDELEAVSALLGTSWNAHGVEQNRAVITTFCREIHAQGIISNPVDPAQVFATFERLTGNG